MSLAPLQTFLGRDDKKFTINVRYKMSESGSGDQSKADKKREYNRNAQRVFRHRRKEHLKNLEAAQREQSSVQGEELDRLRAENAELRQENETLQKIYGSSSSSPAPTASEPPAVPTSFHPSIFEAAPPLPTPAQPILVPPADPEAPLCVLVQHNVAQVRTLLHSLFRPILDITVISNPQCHLTSLAALGPNLPVQLRPTDLQLQTPHHAYIDVIPSPSLRDRLINAGPATANAFLTQVCTAACEIEDHGQIIIWGEDVLNEFSWEFSAAVLEQWGGWLLTGEWGQRANFWRRQRGAPILPAWET